MPVKTDREYRKIDISQLELRKDGENDGMIVEGYASTFNQEYELYSGRGYHVYEAIDKDAFDDADMSDVIMQYDHAGKVLARMRNKTLEVKTDDHGLHVRADLGGTEAGRQLYEEIKGGYIDRMSFGFTVREDQWTEEVDHDTGETTEHRLITRVKKLYDVSAVSIPANDATEISVRSVADGVIDKLEQERLERAREERDREIEILKLMLEV